MQAVDYYGEEFRRNPIGTGPFMFKIWKEGVKLVLVKNPEYFEYEDGKRLPFIDAVAISFIIDKQSAFLEFVKGKLDFMSGIDAAYKDEVLSRQGRLNPKYNNHFSLISQPYLNTEYLAFLVDTTEKEIEQSPFADIRIRKAINYGFDRIKMMKYLRNNIGTPGIYGMVPPGLASFDRSKIKGYTFDPDKARKLLGEAGFPNGLGLPELVLSTTSDYVDLCKYILAELAEIGIKLRIEVNPAATLKELKSQAKLPFFRASWIADYPDAENYLSLFYSKNFCPGGPNYTHYSNPAFDNLYRKSQNEVNEQKRFEYYRQMDQMIMNDAPVVILYYDQVLRFVRNNVSGLGMNAMNLLSLKKVKKDT